MTRDEGYMKLALAQAKKASESGEIPVGAVIVKSDVVIAAAFNKKETKKNPLAHAELRAIKKAAAFLDDWRLSDCEMFVTLEPCAMCAGAIIESRIKRLVFGAFDWGNGFMGSLADLPALALKNDFPVLGGVLSGECSGLLSGFFKSKRTLV